MKPALFPIPIPEAGTDAGPLIAMPRPSAERPAEDLGHVRAAGAQVVVSLMQPQEAAELGLADEAKACAAAGLEFLSHPVEDYGLPEPAPFAALVDALAARLRGGEGLAVHCRAGIGRTGMLTVSLVAAFAGDAEEAFARVSAARGEQVPDTQAQRRFVLELHEDRRGG